MGTVSADGGWGGVRTLLWAEQEWALCPGVHGSEWASVLACVGDCVSPGSRRLKGPV